MDKFKVQLVSKTLLGLLTVGSIVGGVYVLNDINQAKFTYEEYVAFVEMLDYEIEKQGGEITYQNVKSNRDLKNRLFDTVENRDVKPDEKDINIQGFQYSNEDYIKLRKALIEKAKKQITK